MPLVLAEIPTIELLTEARATRLDPRPVPNLGYACLNMELREQRVPIFTNRDCVLKSYIDKGLPFVSGLVKENTKALAAIVHWNHLNGIRFFRCTFLADYAICTLSGVGHIFPARLCLSWGMCACVYSC